MRPPAAHPGKRGREGDSPPRPYLLPMPRRLVIQVHHDALASPLPRRLAAVLAATPGVRAVETGMGTERGRLYHDVLADVDVPPFDWAAVEARLRAEAPAFFDAAIAVLEGEAGWDDYLDLYDYTERRPR